MIQPLLNPYSLFHLEVFRKHILMVKNEAGNAVQDIELTKDEVATENHVIPLKYVKFQNVNSLTIFVKDNQGDEETTVVSYIGLIGQSREKTDMNDFKRVAGKKGESHG
eukprot:sb/3477419/